MSRGGITLRKFEPIKPEKEVISLRLDTRMLQEINDWAMEIDISRNEFINQCIDFALKNIDTELIEQVERRHNGRGGMSRRLRTGFEMCIRDSFKVVSAWFATISECYYIIGERICR